MAKDFDSDKIIDLGKPRKEEFSSHERDDDEIFFPTISLDMDMIPGEVGKSMFVKILLRKVSSDIEHDNERFEMQNMRILGSVDDDESEEKLTPGEGFDKAIEIVMEKKIKITPEED